MSPRSSGATFSITPRRKFHACARSPGASHTRSCKRCPCTSPLRATGMSSGWGTYSWCLPGAQTFGLINAGAVRRRSDGSKRRACTEWHCVQMDNDPCLHHATTCEARVSVGVGKPSSLRATSAMGPQSSAISRNFGSLPLS